nr:SRPBCC family protein [Halomonas sp. JS92-SW72]
MHWNYASTMDRRNYEAGGTKAVDADGWSKSQGGFYSYENGHMLLWTRLLNPEVRPVYQNREWIQAQFGEARADSIVNQTRNLCLYPNVYLMDQFSTQIRVLRPISVDETEVTIYCFAPKGESAENRRVRIRQYEDFFNVSGMGTPDDLEEFRGCQDGYHGALAEWNDSLGLAVIFGLLKIVNFAHGAMYMLGAFATLLGMRYLGINYWAALLLAPLFVGLFGMLLERTLLRRIAHLDHLYGLLLTFGLALIFEGTLVNFFGVSGARYPTPEALQGGFQLGFMFLPKYRAFVLVAAIVVCLFTWYMIERTRLGAYLRAGTENPALMQAFGVNVPLLITLTYLDCTHSNYQT